MTYLEFPFNIKQNYVKKLAKIANKFGAAFLASTILFSTNFAGPVSAQATETCPNPANIIDSWFPHKDTPEPDNANFDSSTICNFHEWSWQMFLWLTQDVSGEPRFLGFKTPYDLLGMDNREVLMPRMKKSARAETFDEFLQAGTDGLLVDQNGNIVYYSQYLDNTFVNFMNDPSKFSDPNNQPSPMAHIPLNPKTTLTVAANVQKFSPDIPFPVGAVRLKASWRIVEDGEDTSKFFTMNSSVYGLKNQSGKIVVDTSNVRDVELALVGFHIGGVVKDHPEMIWATFEQVDNTPVVPIGAYPDDVVSEDDFTFYQGGTKYAGCNVNYANSPLLKLDEATQKLTPITQACLEFEFGNSAKNDPALQRSVETNDSDVAKMNAAVMPRLAASGDVWANYREIGAIWFKPKNALKPNMALATDFASDGSQLLIGSLKLSNSTIETFTQRQSTMNNCFRCHNTEQRFPPVADLDPLKAMNLNISHAFMNIYFWSQQIADGDTLLKTSD